MFNDPCLTNLNQIYHAHYYTYLDGYQSVESIKILLNFIYLFLQIEVNPSAET